MLRLLNNRWWVLSLVLLAAVRSCWPGSANVQTDGSGETRMSNGIPQLKVEKYELRNGLQVILHIDRKLPIVHVNLCFHVGSKDEEPGRFGFAHLFEHIMFQGSKNADQQFIGLVENAGANLFEGGVNGNTEEDRTNYFETVPSGNLEYILWLESDRLATLTEAITQKKFDVQRDVVKNELRSTQQSRPYGRAAALLEENLFPAGHPYAHHPIGNARDLDAASLGDIKDFFRTYYTPNNLSLVIAGDFDPVEAKKLVHKYFADIPPGPRLKRLKQWVPQPLQEKIVEVKDRVAQDRSYVAWATPAFFADDDAALDIISLILTGNTFSRLNRILVQERRLCSEVSSEHNSLEAAGILDVSATMKAGVKFGEVEEAVQEQIRQLADAGPTPSELSRAKTEWESGLMTRLERIGGFGGKADLLNRYNTFLGDPGKLPADIERHRDVTIDDVRHAAQTWLAPQRRLLLRFSSDKAPVQEQTKLDRSQPPPLSKDAPRGLPQAQSARLENGMEVFVLERRGLPKIAATLVVRAGSALDPAGKSGLASLLLESIRGGSGTRSPREIEESLADLGASLEGRAHRDFSTLRLECLKSNAGPALAIFADLIRNPAFTDETVGQERERRLSWLAEAEHNGQFLGSLLSPVIVFGRNHPYGHPVQGFSSTVATITAEDLRRFHATYWKPGSAALIFAGDISLPEAVEEAKKVFSAWRGDAPPPVKMPLPEPDPAKVLVVNLPGTSQTMVRQILLIPGRKSPDYAAIQLADAVWGGGTSARLNVNLRDSKGYAFAVFSHPFVFSNYGSWQSYGSVQAEKVGPALNEFRAELNGLAGDKPITAREFDLAKSNRLHGYIQQLESLAGVSEEFAGLWANGLTAKQFGGELDALEKANLPAVNAAAHKYGSPGGVRLLLLGDLQTLKASLKSAGIEHFEVIDAEGRPVSRKVDSHGNAERQLRPTDLKLQAQ